MIKKFDEYSKTGFHFVTAVERPSIEGNVEKVFLAGGIQKCSEWQKDIISRLEKLGTDKVVYVFNPRRENFPIHDPNASQEQITWEFEALEDCSIFSMYFDNTESAQPICFYELGRNIERMKQKYPDDWQRRIIISCDEGFSRHQDVVIQTDLATGGQVKVNLGPREEIIESHARMIKESVE